MMTKKKFYSKAPIGLGVQFKFLPLGNRRATPWGVFEAYRVWPFGCAPFGSELHRSSASR